MDVYTQQHRLLRISTILGPDHVLLVSLRGRDVLSSCFLYDLELASTDPSIKPDDLLGTSATVWLNDAAEMNAPVNGIISRFSTVRRLGRDLTLYRIRL